METRYDRFLYLTHTRFFLSSDNKGVMSERVGDVSISTKLASSGAKLKGGSQFITRYPGYTVKRSDCLIGSTQ